MCSNVLFSPVCYGVWNQIEKQMEIIIAKQKQKITVRRQMNVCNLLFMYTKSLSNEWNNTQI